MADNSPKIMTDRPSAKEAEKKPDSRSYTSNIAKLLKHMDRLQILQNSGRPVPIMVHLSPCNACNLTCSFCCFANRSMTEMLTFEQMKSAIDQFRAIGAEGLEFTGGGEPTLHPRFDEIVEYAHGIGFKIGVCTNGKNIKRIKSWKYFTWVRLGLYGFDEGYQYDIDVLRKHSLDLSAAYVWDGARETSLNPNITGDWLDKKKKKVAKAEYVETNFSRMLLWVEEHRVPTRVAFNAIKPTHIVQQDIQAIRTLMDEHENRFGPLKYAFLSDFNYKGERRNHNCYMHVIKPFVFTDGNVYVCPSAELAPENKYQVNDEFKLCTIDGITAFYDSLAEDNSKVKRNHACSYCKYSFQNELIDDVLTETKHNEFV